jgi:hypothetical protein
LVSSSGGRVSKPVDETLSSVLVRAESWLETLGGLLALCSYIVDAQSRARGSESTTMTSNLNSERSQGLLGLTRLIVLETNASLGISQTRRKVASLFDSRYCRSC